MDIIQINESKGTSISDIIQINESEVAFTQFRLMKVEGDQSGT